MGKRQHRPVSPSDPRLWPTRLGLALFWLLGQLPWDWLLAAGRGVGRLAWYLAAAGAVYALRPGDQVPQLGQYVHSWQVYDDHRAAAGDEGPELAAGQLPDPEDRSGLGARLEALAERVFESVPLVDRLYRPLKRAKERLRRLLPQKMPPLVARY